MLETALPNSFFELIFKKELIPTCQMDSIIIGFGFNLNGFLFLAFILRHNFCHFYKQYEEQPFVIAFK